MQCPFCHSEIPGKPVTCPRCRQKIGSLYRQVPPPGQIVSPPPPVCQAPAQQFSPQQTQRQLYPPQGGYQTPPMAMPPQVMVNNHAKISLSCGIAGVIGALLFALLGFISSIIGLIYGVKANYTAGIILNIVALVMSVISSIIGVALMMS